MFSTAVSPRQCRAEAQTNISPNYAAAHLSRIDPSHQCTFHRTGAPNGATFPSHPSTPSSLLAIRLMPSHILEIPSPHPSSHRTKEANLRDKKDERACERRRRRRRASKTGKPNPLTHPSGIRKNTHRSASSAFLRRSRPS